MTDEQTTLVDELGNDDLASAGGADLTTTAATPTEPASSDAEERELFDEGEAAADYIEELLDIADIDGDIDIDVRAGRAYIAVESNEPGALAALAKPDVVQAFQELTRLAAQTRTGRFSRVILDVGGSRSAREDELAALVDHAVAKVEAGALRASLPAMSSYERKIVHDLVGARGFRSESEGEGRDRHTVISRA